MYHTTFPDGPINLATELTEVAQEDPLAMLTPQVHSTSRPIRSTQMVVPVFQELFYALKYDLTIIATQ